MRGVHGDYKHIILELEPCEKFLKVVLCICHYNSEEDLRMMVQMEHSILRQVL